MIEYFVRTLCHARGSSFVGARRAEHAQTASTRQLHRCRPPHRRLRALHQHRFTWLRVGALHQPACAVAYGVPMAAPCANEMFSGNGWASCSFGTMRIHVTVAGFEFGHIRAASRRTKPAASLPGVYGTVESQLAARM